MTVGLMGTAAFAAGDVTFILDQDDESTPVQVSIRVSRADSDNSTIGNPIVLSRANNEYRMPSAAFADAGIVAKTACRIVLEGLDSEGAPLPVSAAEHNVYQQITGEFFYHPQDEDRLYILPVVWTSDDHAGFPPMRFF